MPYDDIIEKHAGRVDIDPKWLKKIMHIESGGNPNNTTGSYKGLFQLSEKEFRNHGGSGNIYDPDANTAAAANKLAQEARNFKQKFGRDPKLIDLYMIHQQGEGGYAQHVNNPNEPAWRNMAATGEGRQKGEAWAKRAIWGNLPEADKKRFGSVDNVTSEDFFNVWSGRVEDTGTVWAGTHDKAMAAGPKIGARGRGEDPEGGDPTRDKAADKVASDVTPNFITQPGVETPSFSLPGQSIQSTMGGGPAIRGKGETRQRQGRYFSEM